MVSSRNAWNAVWEQTCGSSNQASFFSLWPYASLEGDMSITEQYGITSQSECFYDRLLYLITEVVFYLLARTHTLSSTSVIKLDVLDSTTHLALVYRPEIVPQGFSYASALLLSGFFYNYIFVLVHITLCSV